MADKLASIIEYIIGVGGMTYAYFILKKKHTEQPNLKFIGLPFKTFSLIIYLGISIFTILLLLKITGQTGK